MAVGHGGTANREKPIVDFLTTFTNFTALVEIKTPKTPIFHSGRRGRSGTYGFSAEFIDAVFSSAEQKAEWLSYGQSSGLFNREGSKQLQQRTREAKLILVIGNRNSIKNCENIKGTRNQARHFRSFSDEKTKISKSSLSMNFMSALNSLFNIGEHSVNAGFSGTVLSGWRRDCSQIECTVTEISD